MKRILIVTCESLAERFAEQFGCEYEVRRCTEVNEALEHLVQWRPDGLVVELQDIDGFEILRNTVYKPPVIIALTWAVNHNVISGAQMQGVTCLYALPCKVSAVIERLNQLIAKADQLEGLK